MMVVRGSFILSWYGLVWAAFAVALWAAAVSAASAHYDTATPYTPPYRGYNSYKYIPVGSNFDRYESSSNEVQESSSNYRLAPSELILTGLRTILDIVRNINAKKRSNSLTSTPRNRTVQEFHRKSANGKLADKGRGFEDYYDEHHHHDEEMTTTPKPMKQSRYTDPWAGYYDWIINEGSFKFWSAFQLFTAALLLYAAFSAIYYAKFNPIIPDYDREYDDYFLERTVGRKARSLDPSELVSGLSWINPRMFQFILDSISKQYEYHEE